MILGYRMFLEPLPIWVNPYIWPLLLLPLCAGVAVVYKAVRTAECRRFPREATQLFVTIVLGMLLAAGSLAVLAHFMQ